MSKRVFLSYSSQDQIVADTICRSLEAARIRCWIAHRDNVPGLTYQEGILDALDSASAIVLPLTGHSNNSRQVMREIEYAITKDVPVFVLRLEDVTPSRQLAFFLNSIHWIDAWKGLFDDHLKTLRQGIKRSQSNPDTRRYFIQRGIEPMQAYTGMPKGDIDRSIGGVEFVESLRTKLIEDRVKLENPREIKVYGTLFPCALLSSGWWERRADKKVKRLNWQNGTQEWLFHGFDLWGPSWDFTWNIENENGGAERPYFIAQLGDGDEANSIPVLLPAPKAIRLHELFRERTRDGRRSFQVEVTCVLGHRRHFAKYVDKHALELFGGLLDYCLWVDADNKNHGVEPKDDLTDIYSGYLWKCLAPKDKLAKGTFTLTDVYFVWDHANLMNDSAVAYSVDALQAKENFIRKLLGNQELVLIQKSSDLVPGTPALTSESIYDILLGKPGFKI
jgi:hypothetical protein